MCLRVGEIEVLLINGTLLVVIISQEEPRRFDSELVVCLALDELPIEVVGVETEHAVVEDGIDVILRVLKTNRRMSVTRVQFFARSAGE